MDPYFKGKADLPERFLRDQLLFLLQGHMLEKALPDLLPSLARSNPSAY